MIPEKAVLADGHVLAEAVPKLFIIKRDIVGGLMRVDLGQWDSASKHPCISHNVKGQDRAGVGLERKNIHVVEFVSVGVIFGKE